MKFALRIAYLGKNYCGFQKQLKDPVNTLVPSIQEILEHTLTTMLETKTSVVPSGRTDRGVNAVGQIVHFKCDNPKFTEEIFRRGMNSHLPEDIRVLQVFKVSDDFHAQRSATHKQYSYYFQQGPCPLPHLLDTTWWIYRKLDLAAMRKALTYFVGAHDFLAFQGRKAKPSTSTVRTILEAELIEEAMPSFPGMDLADLGFSVIRIRLVGTGFLKQMVRGIAGTVLQIGEGKRPPEDVKMILETLDRRKVGPTSPAKGLTLERVWYKIDC